jgi:hypothetical protein
MCVKWRLILVSLEIVLISMQDRCLICAERAIGSEEFWAHPMEYLGDVGQLEAHFGPFGESVNLDARYVHSLLRRSNRLENHIGTRWNS